MGRLLGKIRGEIWRSGVKNGVVSILPLDPQTAPEARREGRQADTGADFMRSFVRF